MQLVLVRGLGCYGVGGGMAAGVARLAGLLCCWGLLWCAVVVALAPLPCFTHAPALPHVDAMADVPAWIRRAWGVGRFSVWLACALGAWHLGGWGYWGCWQCCCLRRGSGLACGCFGGGASWIGPLRKDDRSRWTVFCPMCLPCVGMAVLSSCQYSAAVDSRAIGRA